MVKYLSELSDDEIKEKLFNMELREILNSRLINKNWYRIVSSDKFWCRLLKRDYDVVESLNCEKYYRTLHFKLDKYLSYEMLLWRFIDKLPKKIKFNRVSLFKERNIVKKTLRDFDGSDPSVIDKLSVAYRHVINILEDILSSVPVDRWIGTMTEQLVINPLTDKIDGSIIILAGKKYYNEIVELAIDNGYLYKKDSKNTKIMEKDLVDYLLQNKDSIGFDMKVGNGYRYLDKVLG